MPQLPNKARTEYWLRYIVHHPGQTILLIGLVTLIFAYQLPALKFETSIYNLTIEDLPETLAYNQFKQAFGSEAVSYTHLTLPTN